MRKSDLLPVQLMGEPARWYSRLCQFCLVGPSRTLEGFWRVATKSSKKRLPSSWRNACEKWDWRKRAAEFDRARARQELERLDSQRRAELNARVLRIQGLGNYLDEMLRPKNTKAYTPVEIVAVARTYFAASREEFGLNYAELKQVNSKQDAQQRGPVLPELHIVVKREQPDGTLANEPLVGTPVQHSVPTPQSSSFYFARSDGGTPPCPKSEP